MSGEHKAVAAAKTWAARDKAREARDKAREAEAARVCSDALLERIVRKAFKAGQNWAETYVSWFQPSAEATERKIEEALHKAKMDLSKARKAAETEEASRDKG